VTGSTRPQFDFTETEFGVISARVTLPISVDPAVRTATSLKSWATERLAKQDAAFQAYTALYRAGLINDNLLPARYTDDELSELQLPDHRPSLVQVSPTLDPWPLVAQHQQANPHVYYRTLLTLRSPSEAPVHMLLFTPTVLPNIPEIILYWNESIQFQIDCSWLSKVVLGDDEVSQLRLVTYTTLFSVFEGRVKADRRDFLWLLAPCTASGHLDNLEALSKGIQNSCPASDLIAQGRNISDWGLVTRISDSKKYMLKAIGLDNHLQLVRVPKRRDFLHPVPATSQANDAYTKIEDIAAVECVVYDIPTACSVFALLCPSILHRIEVGIVAETLRTTILSRVALGPAHLPLLIRALTSSATGEHDNYQRLEFLGDCILKLFATLHLMAANLHWPESYLTARKGKVVSNGFLARATLATGLESFIITKRFTGAKWGPRYVGDLLAEAKAIPRVQRSSKLLADVIESLIGASYAVGALDKAFLCIRTLLPVEPWTPIHTANTILYEAAPAGDRLVNFSILERLVGHTFNKKTLLLEALTHGSFKGPNHDCSYERLEFLGDAVLDYIISTRLYAHEPSLSHQNMHAIRTATVNASFLAFRMFETTVPEETTNKTTMQPELQHRALWQFLRSGDPALNANRNAALQQHEHARKHIIAGLNGDARYPWHLFALTDAPKFLSDIVESVIGAVYIDSHGDIPTCEMVVRSFGILDYLEHILNNGVDCLHPKERLGHLAVERDVQYVCVEEDKATKTAGVKVYKCQVKVGGENIGGAVEGLKRLNAETIAAWRAVSILESRGDMVMRDVSDDEEFFDVDEGGGVILEDY
jgi:dsRNA-specific ribonuclease